ncbi:FAD:protein FMN transferase [Methyloparacoccus murrellii]
MTRGGPVYVEQAFNAMGSPCEIKLYAKTRPRAMHMVRRAIAEVERLEARYSRYRPDSLLSAINQIAATGGQVRVDEETAGLLNYVETCYRESGGLFDVTSGLLRHAWRFRDGRVPEPATVATLLARIGWHRLRWEPPVLAFPEPGLELDFGGAVKEYAVDRVAALCWEAEIRHGLINLGGDIKIIGPHPDGSPWAIGIAHPRQPGSFIRTLRLQRGAMASSGDYERCIEVDGVRYGHVLNPRTGWPVRHLAAVSVVADLCVVAGSAATIAMLKEAQGPAWLAELGLAHFWVDVHGRSGGNWMPGAR